MHTTEICNFALLSYLETWLKLKTIALLCFTLLQVRKDVSLLLTSLLSRLTALERYEAFLRKIALETPPENQAAAAVRIIIIIIHLFCQ